MKSIEGLVPVPPSEDGGFLVVETLDALEAASAARTLPPVRDVSQAVRRAATTLPPVEEARPAATTLPPIDEAQRATTLPPLQAPHPAATTMPPSRAAEARPLPATLKTQTVVGAAPEAGEPERLPPAPCPARLRGELPRVGERLGGGRYHLVRLLGRGGLGVVFLATDALLERGVAIQFVQLDEDCGVALLRDEVARARRVVHPNVCRTYDVAELDGLWAVRMELVVGRTLARRMAEGPLALDEALRIARAVAEGLAAAHAQGVVHREVRASNVMLEDGTGRVVLMGLGLARSLLVRPRDGSADVGAPVQMSFTQPPELAERRHVDGRADLYALGCVLYEMLTGRAPFVDGATGEPLRRRAGDPPPDPRAVKPKLPVWLARLVVDLLQHDPARRPASAAAVLAALAGPEKPRRTLSRVAAAALIAGVAVAGGAALRARAHDAAAPAVGALRAPPGDARVLSPDGRWIAYTSDRGGGWRLYVEPSDGGDARALTPLGALPVEPRWSRDGRWLLYVDAGGGRWRVPAAGGARELVDARAVVQGETASAGGGQRR